ncbi:transcriptional regulator family: Fungal Specific TF [Penicillium cf. griseofulvum]|uniref:Transcriptional regulator family: Fungal Specific TF n=1 Tax=Penicillium cf. griseofulvum TaxID=2972120 RepID=A0A9W9JBR8_9EURO|nr:transcriptional regulator family: Fungal Specific TF [Penicillium cf. griseofulvum]KAJ5445412.1 transcriptional regulator family: Fungal Specific TF [Penicillium cf. griseofulvum]KAJ5447132.1 transcriptional regulator family: Fungal Specific TF [Penicillium cf. griseofulvum]
MSRRIGAVKSRTGCTTCKIRKVKCGEEKPSCLRCSNTGRKCEYEGRETPPWILSTPSHTLSLSQNATRRERRAFAYYFQHVSQRLAGGMNVDFWTGVVPQICRSEPTVWDAIIAISALYENPKQCMDFHFLKDRRRKARLLDRAQEEALTWYSRSISGVSSQIQRGSADPYIALISCALFICVETIQGRMEKALELYRQGISLILDLRAQIDHGRVSTSKAVLLERSIAPLFLRLGTSSLTISGTQFPFELLAFVETDMSTGFASVDSARTIMSALAAEVILFEREASLHLKAVGTDSAVSPEMVAKKEALRARLAEWHRLYTNICQRNSPVPTVPIYPEPILLTYHATALIYVTGCLRQQETVFDNHFSDFVTIVEQSRLILDASAGPNGAQPPFTFEMSVGVPLAVTVLRCRDPILRRRALDLLLLAPPIQGFFKCVPVALLSETLMKLEENYSLALRQDNTVALFYKVPDNNVLSGLSTTITAHETTRSQAALIPEEARIHDYGIFRPNEWQPSWITEEDFAPFSHDRNQLYLGFSRYQYDKESSTWRPTFQCIPLKSGF